MFEGNAQAAQRGGARPVALIIDPDVAARQDTFKLFSSCGFEVLTAASGDDGLAVAHRSQPTIVAVEMELPGLDSWEVIRQLRARTDSLIMLVTLGDDETALVGGLQAGADSVIFKPLRAHEFRARVSALIRRCQVPQQGTGTSGIPAIPAQRAGSSMYVVAGIPRSNPTEPVGMPATSPQMVSAAPAAAAGYSRAPVTPLATKAPWTETNVIAFPSQAPVPALEAPPDRTVEWVTHRGLSYEPNRRLVSVEGHSVHLEPEQFDLMLEVFMHGGALCRRDELALVARASQGGHTDGPVTHGERLHIDQAMSALLTALGEQAFAPRWIEAVPGVGYRLLT